MTHPRQLPDGGSGAAAAMVAAAASASDEKYTQYAHRPAFTRPPVTVAATQMACSWNLEENIQRAEALVRKAASMGSQIILIQELFQAWYFCQWQRGDYFGLAGSANVDENPLLQHFSRLAAELQVVLPVSFFERAGNAHYNSIIVFDADGASLGLYRKSHIPDGPGYQEKYYFNPGDTGFRVFRSRYGIIGVAICWDQWFPEAARCMALLGAEILFYPTAIGSEPQDATLDSRVHWETVMRGHAGANLVPLVASNRVGTEKDITFYGCSFIADPTGALVCKATDNQEEILTATFDLDAIQRMRSAWGIFRDRRPELYTPILSLDGQRPSSAVMQAMFLAQQQGASSFAAPSAPAYAWLLQHSAPARSISNNPAALSLPSLDGFRMPAEWELHKRTWMAWPTRPDNWRQDAKPAQRAFAAVAKAIAQFEPLTMCAGPLAYAAAADALREAKTQIIVAEVSSDDSWMRDIGNTCVDKLLALG